MKKSIHTVRWQKLLRAMLAVLLMAALCLNMVACAKKDDTKDKQTESTASTEESESTEPSKSDEETDPTDESESEPFAPVGTGEATSPAAKATYSTTTATPGDADMKTVVATYDGGTLTNGELNVYFWMEFYNFLNSEMGSYASMLGLDPDAPLAGQASMAPIDENDENSAVMSWEQYFLQATMENYAYYKGLELDAKAQNFVLPESYQKDLDNLEKNVKDSATESGYETADEFVQASFGSGTTLQDYVAYMTSYIYSYAYYETVLAPQCDATDEEVTAYFDENADTYSQSGIQKTDKHDVSVRHILIQPAEEYSVDSDGDGKNDSYTDEEWAAAEEKANTVYAQWQQDPTEENFINLAKDNSADGNASTGGLYENVHPGQMVEEFSNWCFDDTRATGDNGIVKTQYGYHIMYFVSTADTFTWFETAKSDLVGQQLGDLSKHVSEQYTVDFDCNKIVLCDVVTANTAKQ